MDQEEQKVPNNKNLKSTTLKYLSSIVINFFLNNIFFWWGSGSDLWAGKQKSVAKKNKNRRTNRFIWPSYPF